MACAPRRCWPSNSRIFVWPKRRFASTAKETRIESCRCQRTPSRPSTTTFAWNGRSPTRPHQLRHSYASEMLRAGVSLPAVKELLGHRDIRMTRVYIQVTQNDLPRQYRQDRSPTRTTYPRRKMSTDWPVNQPLSDRLDRFTQKAKWGWRGIQLANPAAEGGRGSHSVGIFQHRSRRFPATPFDKASPQGLTAGEQTVVGVRKRAGRKEGEGRPAELADAPANANPVVVLVMRLFAPSSVADDGILQATRAAAD